MLKIIKSLFTIVAVGAIATGATGAYFTDQVTVADNHFTAGKVDIDIRGAGATAQMLANMAPGVWTAPVEYQVYNLGDSLPVKYRIQDAKVSESVEGYYDKINVRVRHTHATPDPDPSTWPVVYSGPLKYLNIVSNSTPGIISPTLGTNITHVFYLEYQLSAATGDEYQGATAVANLVFDATQTNNPGW